MKFFALVQLFIVVLFFCFESEANFVNSNNKEKDKLLALNKKLDELSADN